MDIDKLSSRIIRAAIRGTQSPCPPASPELAMAGRDLVCLNFNVPLMRDGIVRIVNELEE